MARRSRNNAEQSERLRALVDQRMKMRGKFEILESVSKIKSDHWRNFYYKKQAATTDMLTFWGIEFPQDKTWLLTGQHDSTPGPNLEQVYYPAPDEDERQTLGDRLIWAIKHSIVAPPWEYAFQSLENHSKLVCKELITAEQWSRMILKIDPPTGGMVQVVCKMHPCLTEWIIFGKCHAEKQVDPTSLESAAMREKAVAKLI